MLVHKSNIFLLSSKGRVEKHLARLNVKKIKPTFQRKLPAHCVYQPFSVQIAPGVFGNERPGLARCEVEPPERAYLWQVDQAYFVSDAQRSASLLTPRLPLPPERLWRQ